MVDQGRGGGLEAPQLLLHTHRHKREDTRRIQTMPRGVVTGYRPPQSGGGRGGGGGTKASSWVEFAASVYDYVKTTLEYCI